MDGAGLTACRSFCGYCGREAEEGHDAVSRVCEHCEMGLVLRAPATVAPRPGDPFLVVDDLMAVRALSREAEHLLGAAETAVVGRHVSEVLAPAELAPAESSVTGAIARALRHGAAATTVAMHPRRDSGVRFVARVVACEPGPAALIVVTERP